MTAKPAAKKGDQVVGTDTHILLVPGTGGTPTPTPMPFTGVLDGELSQDVVIEDADAAIVGSTASNKPSHIPTGGIFQNAPSNQAEVQQGSCTVMINDKPAARTGDLAITCNDPVDLANGTVVAVGTVLMDDVKYFGS